MHPACHDPAFYRTHYECVTYIVVSAPPAQNLAALELENSTDNYPFVLTGPSFCATTSERLQITAEIAPMLHEEPRGAASRIDDLFRQHHSITLTHA